MTKGRWALLVTLLIVGAGATLAVSPLGIGGPPQTAPQTAEPLQGGKASASTPIPTPTPTVSVQPPAEGMQRGPRPQAARLGASEGDRERLRREIALLRLLAEMGLTREQLQALQGIVADLKTKRDAIWQAQLELRDFLLGYSGPDDGQTLEEALRPYEEKIESARKDFREGLQGAVDRLKGILTLKQGEVLREFLRKHFAVPAGREKEDEEEIHLWLFPRPPFPLPKEGKIEVHIRGHGGPGPQRDRPFAGSWEEQRERLRGEIEALPERMEGWFAPWDWDWDWIWDWGWDWDVRGEADWQALREKLEALREQMPEWRLKFEGERPQFRLRLRGEMPWFALNALLQRFLVENLDLLDTILTEKLERLGTLQL